MRAAAYLRISQDRTGEELGVTRQREDCLALASRRGWTLDRVFVDNDTSAKGHKVRPEWERMMAEVEAGRLDVLVGWNVDRTLRNGRDRLRILESGKAHGLTISLVRGSDMDLSTPSGRLAADILGAVAQNEIEAKSDRQVRAHQQAAQQGRRMGGRRPFGYETDGVTIRQAEADAVKAAYKDYLAGTPLTTIAQRWTAAGLTSGVVRKDGTERWENIGVRKVIQNPRYMGMRRYQPEDGPEEVHPAAWPALVDESTWRAANALLESVASRFKPKGGRQLLTGVALCGVCDAAMVGGGGRTEDGPMYRCPSMKHVHRRGTDVERAVVDLVAARLERGDVLAGLAQGREEPDLSAKRMEITTELETIARERASRSITSAQFRILNESLQVELAEVEAQMSRAGQVDVLGSVLAEVDPAGRFRALDRDQQRVVIGMLMEVRLDSAGRGKRVFDPRTVRVTWLR